MTETKNEDNFASSWLEDGVSITVQRHLRALLGGPLDFDPYIFNYADGGKISAENGGLEGFYYTLCRVHPWYSQEFFDTQLPYMLTYLRQLSRRVGSVSLWQLVQAVEKKVLVLNSSFPRSSPGFYLVERLENCVEYLRARVKIVDHAQWSQSCAMYQILLPAFNLQERRAITGGKATTSSNIFEELQCSDLPGKFDAIRWTGTYPIGTLQRKGSGDGSPFAVSDHSTVASRWGSALSVARGIENFHAQGVKSIFECLPNHTAVDAELLAINPTLYIHRKDLPHDCDHWYKYQYSSTAEPYWIRRGGYSYDGVRFYWDDTLQLDLSNPCTIDMLVLQLNNIVSQYGVDGFRVDMAYQLLNSKFSFLWQDEAGYPLGVRVQDEILYKLIWGVKEKHPCVAFIAEGFDSIDRLSAVGFDLIYSKNEMTLPGGVQHQGWYNALESRNSDLITKAIRRSAFMNWQVGGAGMLHFIGHHDLPGPWRVFNDWMWGAAFLTILLPSASVWYNGTEVKFEVPCEENGKMITFNKPVSIDWSGIESDWFQFITKTLSIKQDIRETFVDIELHELGCNADWVGYLLVGTEMRKGVVLVNLSNAPTHAFISFDSFGGGDISVMLPNGKDGCLWIEL
jgi:hypothetical protein